MTSIHAEIDIDASPEAVWAVLADLDGYRDWNPFITDAAGIPAVGERLDIRIETPSGRATSFTPRVQRAVQGEELSWRGRLFLPGLFDGTHSFIIESRGENWVRFVQRETFSGLLVPMLLDAGAVLNGFEAMNRALKDRVEARVAVDGDAAV